MQLRILLPFGVFATITDVSAIVAQTNAGSVGLLPNRRDCVAVLTPGILAYTTSTGTTYLAADEGLLVKRARDVTVSLRHCIRGPGLVELRAAVKREFSAINEREQATRIAITQVEAGLFGRIAEFQRER